MTKKETIRQLKYMLERMPDEPPLECDYIEEWLDTDRKIRSAFKTAIKIIEQEPCEDCVSREEALEGLNSINGTSELDKAFEVIENLPSVTTTQRWIPVSERLPEESLNSVIGWDAYRERCVFVQYIDGHFQITGSDESFDILAWMPLPKPYK